jgi:hypothetical protein
MNRLSVNVSGIPSIGNLMCANKRSVGIYFILANRESVGVMLIWVEPSIGKSLKPTAGNNKGPRAKKPTRPTNRLTLASQFPNPSPADRPPAPPARARLAAARPAAASKSSGAHFSRRRPLARACPKIRSASCSAAPPLRFEPTPLRSVCAAAASSHLSPSVEPPHPPTTPLQSVPSS